MIGRGTRFTMVCLLAVTCVLSVVGTPNIARGSEGGFTAAATILKQSGKLGYWMFPDPPGFPPVKCTYYPYGENPNGIPVSRISASGPIIYSVPGLDGQPVHVTYRLNQRWPDGSLHPKSDRQYYGTAAGNSPMQVGTWFYTYDRGSTFVLTVEINWYFGSSEVGRVELLYTQYQSNIDGSPRLPVTNACKPLHAATATLGSAEGTVGSSIPFKIDYFPSDPDVGIYFDGTRIGTIATDSWGTANGNFIVPAAPMGNHTVKFYRFGRTVSKTFTIKPRIKVIPSSNIMRDQTVNVSLRGFAAGETVAIRWKKSASWVQIAKVKTSSTGSANIDVAVPKWVPNGSTSVRADGTYGHAQTNAVTVAGGPMSSSSVKPTPTADPTKTATPSPSPTAIPATATPEPTSTPAATEQPATPEATNPETATPQPTDTATPSVEPTEEPPSPTETPTPEPTDVPVETPDPAATEQAT